jgi:hypothetical protein
VAAIPLCTLKNVIGIANELVKVRKPFAKFANILVIPIFGEHCHNMRCV